MDVAVDWRWMRNDGIGRFAKETVSRLSLDVSPVHPPVSLFNPIEQLWTSYKLSTLRPTLYFTPGINPPLFSSVPFVFVIHDLIPLRFSEETSVQKKVYYRTVLRLAVQRARWILTVSEFSKQKIVRWADVDPEQIRVVGNGVKSRFRPDGPAYNPGSPYLLYVGNTRPHKNVGAAIEGFARSGIADDVRLILSGTPDSQLKAVIREHGVENRVEFAHFIPERDLPAYYRGATALVHPSLYEGFGLTVLEALACGTPVVASNATAIPEVTGDAALLFDPTDVEEIAASIRRVVRDSSLQHELRGRGIERARQFSWEQVAHRTEEALHAAVG
ncbi:glycosyltransferase involved in cell wall biosynthesis [Salinibacter ruber]|jgi:glycosyltransferase involved in cell wall biosynthesis|uniref:glycosyltransferase family 4 protein n=1 Tax=Salinibacter ruber TaxID=146919 RepID=UPI002167496A|nr:glycosyltransferase family 1 protein [Salinibacter ruber]MCS4138419.1 glycosyltransferase involved in cell wall biosynthesis [Salinibacter ruber]